LLATVGELRSCSFRRLRLRFCIEDGVIQLAASRKNGRVSRCRIAEDFALAS